MPTEAEIRKERSIERLKLENVPYIEHLPVIESTGEITIPTIETIAKRAVCTLITIQHACDLLNNNDIEDSREFCVGLLEKWNLMTALTEKEKAVLAGLAEEQDLLNMVWKYEAYWVLVWALGFVDELVFPSETCDCDRAIEIIVQFKGFDEFLAAAKLRPATEILDAADYIFRLDWACVDARINNKEVPAKMDSSVVLERHRALNWLIGYGEGDWDDMPTDT